MTRCKSIYWLEFAGDQSFVAGILSSTGRRTRHLIDCQKHLDYCRIPKEHLLPVVLRIRTTPELAADRSLINQKVRVRVTLGLRIRYSEAGFRIQIAINCQSQKMESMTPHQTSHLMKTEAELASQTILHSLQSYLYFARAVGQKDRQLS